MAVKVIDNELYCRNFIKDNGIYYTDFLMAKIMLSQLSIDKDTVVVDPCCGIGNFLTAALEDGIRNVYGADIDPAAIEICKGKISQNRAVNIDTLGNSPDKLLSELNLFDKPDIVIGNPPYAPITGTVKIITEDLEFNRKVKKYGNNLFIAALVRAMELVNIDGFISYIIPKNFLHVSSYSALRKELLINKTIISIVDIGPYFKNVRGEQVVLTIKNSIPDGKHKIEFKKFNGTDFKASIKVLQGFYQDEIIIFHSYKDYVIYEKLACNYKTLADVCTGYIGRGRSLKNAAIHGKDLKKFGYKRRSVPQNGNQIFIQNIYSAEAGIIGAFGGDLEASQTITVLTDGNLDMCHYILGILHSRLSNFFLYKYCFNNSKLTMHTDAKYIVKLPFIAKKDLFYYRVIDIVKSLEENEYLNEQWFTLFEELNQMIYSIYGLNIDDIEYIDNEIRYIQSKRWVQN